MKFCIENQGGYAKGWRNYYLPFEENNYFDEGARFEVEVFDENNKAIFIDYHWGVQHI